ncbi:MAG: AAA family ATPase [bacterium]|nr:AAA family ATPase [bacterium]
MVSLESEIVEWSASRPAWQISVMRRLLQGDSLSQADYVEIATQLASGSELAEVPIRLEEVLGGQGGGGQVSLKSLEVSSSVNALVPGQRLLFPSDGLVVVYGDNGSGKSGFARLLKDVARSRHREDVLSDIFSENDGADQRAEVGIAIGGVEQPPYSWPSGASPELRQIGYFDAACGDAYLAADSEVTFRPAGVFLLEGLIRACDGVRAELDRLLQENARRAELLSEVSQGGAASVFLGLLSADSTTTALDAACAVPADASEQLEQLQGEESRLRTSDPDLERKRLLALADHYEKVGKHFSNMRSQLSPTVIRKASTTQAEATALRSAATIASGASFEAEPVPGVGSEVWRLLWEAARTFAETEAHPGQLFPADADTCVLCHQTLDDEARTRFGRFEAAVRDETERRAAEAEREAVRETDSLLGIATSPAPVLVSLEQIADQDLETVEVWRDRLKDFDRVVASVDDLSACLTAAEAAQEGDEVAVAMASAEALRNRASAVDSPQYAAQLADVSAKRVEIGDQIVMARARRTLESEVGRLRERRLLDAAKKATDTGVITRKATDLARSHVTTLVRDRFTRESDRLRLERVTLEDTGGQKGRLQHRPAFVGAIQQPAMAKVLSEGEQTALGLAGFFTEAYLDDTKSAIVLDDPVSSLDHIRRERVASRLAELAQDRQVVVFTHDLAFVVDLARAAREAEVPMVERSVERRGDGRPGVCQESHPWKTRDVNARLGTLEADLAQIRREMTGWQQEDLEKEVADWAGKLSETWERLLSIELVGRVVDRTTLEVRPRMLKVLAHLTPEDNKEFQESYARVSRWARRHDKSPEFNYVAPEIDEMEEELTLVRAWFERIKQYANG